MTISLIAAVAKKNIIGNDNKLLWHLPADLKHFKEITSGNTVIMGRKTFQSIGKPLPNRKNIIITRQEKFKAEGAEVFHHLKAAIESCAGEPEVFIIGGGEIYRQAINIADKIYLTRIDASFEGDTKFPEFSLSEWRLTKYIRHRADEKNKYDYSYSEYERAY